MEKNRVLLVLESREAIETIPEKFISVALDASQIVGGFWWDGSDTVVGGVGNNRVPPLDLENRELIAFAAALAPFCLRIGGTEADRLFYSVKSRNTGDVLTEGYHYVLGRDRWREIERFCRRIGARLMITLNAGPGPRHEKNRWRRKNARQLIRYAETKNHDVHVWELGNEVNAYPFFMGMSHRLSAGEYARDMKRLKRMIPPGSQALTAGPALAVWPVLGETLPFMRRFLKKAEGASDLITWHYYPQQSSRSIAAVRRAGKKTLLKPSRLDEAGRQARRLKRIRDRWQPDAVLWLGETGHALCGGEAGLSDSFYSGFWWLDQLGLMARWGQKQIVRQTLTGGDYGLLDKIDHRPLPDFWTTLLWNRYAGSRVYALKPRKNRMLRLYLHSLKGRDGYCLIYISLEQNETVELEWDEELPPAREEARLCAENIYGREIFLNGMMLDESCLPAGPQARRISPVRKLDISPLSYGFFLLY